MTTLSTREDMHVRIPATRLDRAIARSVRCARRAGLSRIACVIDVSCIPDDGLPAFVTVIERQRRPDDVAVHAAVEARFIDERGTLDVPPDIAGIDYIYTGTGAVPVGDHTYSAHEIRRRLQASELSPDEVIEHLINAFCCAMVCHRGLVLSSPFAVLESLDMSDADISDHQLMRMTDVAYNTRAILAVTERSRGPSLRVVRAFVDARVPVFVGTGTECPGDIGRYDYCHDLVKMVARSGRAPG